MGQRSTEELGLKGCILQKILLKRWQACFQIRILIQLLLNFNRKLDKVYSRNYPVKVRSLY